MTNEDAEPGAGTTVSRRRMLTRVGGIAAVAGLTAATAGGVLVSRHPPPPTVVIDEASGRQLATLSRTVCGGGEFDPAQTDLLLSRLAADPALSRGFIELLLDPPAAGTSQPRSPDAEAAMREILLFWYAGELDGQPMSNRAAAYDRLTAWQAMYTPAFAVCKAYGEWAEAPSDQPAVPSA